MKISFIGAGGVASSTAFATGLCGICDEMVLLDINENFAKGKAIDLQQGFLLAKKDISVIGTNDYSYVKGSSVIVITAGVADKSGSSDREALLEKNKEIISDIANRLKEVIPTDDKQPLIIMVTNPLDIILQHFIKYGNFNKKKTVGSGNWLDTGRFKYYLAKEFNVKQTQIETYTVGQHGVEMVYLLSQTKINGKPLFEYMKENNISEEKIKEICNESTGGANEIISLLAKEGTVFGPAVSIYDVIEAYIKNSERIVSLSVYTNGEYGFKDTCIGLPIKINGSGVKEIIEYSITDEEKTHLNKAYNFIKELNNK